MAKKAEIVKPVVLVEPAQVQQMIHVIRGERVILDTDLARLYGVETKVLNKQVQRNIERFPEDFMFQLDNQEFTNLRFQNGTTSWGGSRYLPHANELVGAQMEAINESLVELAVKVDSLTAKKREPMNPVGFAATEARYEEERRKKAEESKKDQAE